MEVEVVSPIPIKDTNDLESNNFKIQKSVKNKTNYRVLKKRVLLLILIIMIVQLLGEFVSKINSTNINYIISKFLEQSNMTISQMRQMI